MQVVLVRHGRPLIECRRSGIADPRLDPYGEWQAERVSQWLAHEPIDAIVTSPKVRAIETVAPLMKRLGIKHDIPGQVAMEQIMACGLGACYICMRTFEVNGERVLRRVCREGPVFNIQETVGW